MSIEVNPTLRRRELAKYFRDLRQERGYQLEQVAEALGGASLAKASRIESGARGLSAADARLLSDFYGLPATERDRILEIARESQQRGWWQRVELPTALRTYIGLEQAALAINEYSTSVIPGLLQISEYTAALVDANTDNTPEMKQTTVDVRLARQGLLERPEPPTLWAVVDEAALHRVIGGREVMLAQLERLRELAARPRVTVQLIPFEAGAHPGLNSDFVLLQLSDDRRADVVFAEGLVGFLFQDTPEDVRRYQRAWAQLVAIALSPRETAQRVDAAAVALS